MSDPYLSALKYLTACFGQAKSDNALLAGLPRDGDAMSALLFTQAADKAGLRTKMVGYKNIADIPKAVLPAVLLMQDGTPLILLETEGEATLYDPVTDQKRTVSYATLDQDYAGEAILIKPVPQATAPDGAEAEADKQDAAWFWDIVGLNNGIYGLALLAAIFINIFALTSPLFIMNVYDRVIPNAAIETGWALGIGALIVYSFDLIMRVLRSYLIDVAGRRIDILAARAIFDQVLNMRLAFKPRSSGVFANMLRDFDQVRDFLTSATITTLVDLPFTLFFLFIIYQIGGPIALLLAGLIISVFMIGLIIQIPLKISVRKAVASSEAKHGLLVEAIAGLETIKSIGADGLIRARYMAHMAENALHSQNSRFWSGLGVSIASFLQHSASVLVVLMGMYMARDQDLSMGGLIACVLLGSRAIAPIGQIANLMARYHQAGSALKAIDGLMDKPVDRPQTRTFLSRAKLDGNIIAEGLKFAYPAVKRDVLNGASFKIAAGERVGIVGRIGSGKSTIARMLMGLYQPDSGRILFDDTDMRQIDPEDLKRNIAYISQDIILFGGSVRDNIALSKPSASEDEILTVAKVAGVHDFIATHPMGYDAPVGEQGQALSGGQRQAIALARAMLVDPRILICDEPTNAMDMQAEKAFRDYIATQLEGRTLILITHKSHMLTLVDRLIVVEQGRVLKDGPRDEVLKALESGEVKYSA